MRMRALLFLPLTALPGCDLFTGPSLTEYRDVWWHPVGMDGVVTTMTTYQFELGNHTWQSDGGAALTCDVDGWISGYGFGWVELASTGRVVRIGPGTVQEPYELLHVSIQSLCDPEDAPLWTISAAVLADAEPNRDDGVLRVGSIGFGEVMIRHDWVDVEEAARWLQVGIGGGPLADTMHIPVELRVRAWHPDGTTLLGEWTRTVELMYVRQETVHERGAP